MNLAEQANGEGKAIVQACQPVIQRRDVALNLLNVVKRDTGQLLALVEKEVGQRGLGAFDLRGQHSFFANRARYERRLS